MDVIAASEDNDDGVECFGKSGESLDTSDGVGENFGFAEGVFMTVGAAPRLDGGSRLV